MTAPLARGSISLRLYPHLDRPPTAIVEELRTQAALAAAHGWDGVMTSEHHGGFHGYLPNPLQLAGWLLEAMPTGWAAACPLLLPLRPAALVAEEVAWLDARFPGRVGLGVAAGGLPADFELLGVPGHDLAARFTAGLEEVSRLLRGDDGGSGLLGDPALAARADAPIPLVSAAGSRTGARRAARAGAGLVLDSLMALDRARALIDVYRDAGGTGTVVLIRRAWIGEPPKAALDAQVDLYRSYAPAGAVAGWGDDELVAVPDADAVAGELLAALEATGGDALNIRVTVPGIGPELVREQIAALGDQVLPRVRAGLG